MDVDALRPARVVHAHAGAVSSAISRTGTRTPRGPVSITLRDFGNARSKSTSVNGSYLAIDRDYGTGEDSCAFT